MDSQRAAAVTLAKRLLIDVLWKTANIEVDRITFPDTEEIFDGRAPQRMRVDDIVVVNNIKHAWEFLLTILTTLSTGRTVHNTTAFSVRVWYAILDAYAVRQSGSEALIGFLICQRQNPVMIELPR